MKFYFSFFSLLFVLGAQAQVYHNLSAGAFKQNWTDTTLIRVADEWTNVPSIIGYIGNDGVPSGSSQPVLDPQIIVTNQYSDTIDVIPGIKAPKSNTTGGVGEMEIDNPTIALQGSGTADAPNIIIYLNTLNCTSIRVKYKLRDVDSSTDNSIQPVALQYRIGNTADFINIPEAFVADASDGPSLGGKETDVNVILPAACNNVEQLQLRILTGNAQGTDEWIGIDDIVIEQDASASVGNILLDPSVLRIHSNPVLTNQIVLSFNKTFNSPVSLRLLDQSGKLISARSLNRISTGQTESISFDHLPTGVYYLQVLSKEGTYSTKILR
jgi:hypothetical protein